ncbi:MAG: DUF4326 domain-containing protein [Rhodospirillaceae bacterium]|nr:DUF4326 domain-containing protein [Rhodospirillaceae bacterium]
MDAVINLRTEPRLREEFEYAQVLDNTVLIDRRTKWGNPFRMGKGQNREQAIARYREDLWRRIRAGEIALEDLAALDGCWLAASRPQGCARKRRPGSRRVSPARACPRA